MYYNKPGVGIISMCCLICVLIGFSLGRVTANTTEKLTKAYLEIDCNNKKEVIVEKRVLISERKEACEELGGKYHFFWGSLSKEYQERCEIPEQEVEF